MVEVMPISKIVLVFKTDINTDLEQDVRTILSQLEAITKVDFDFEDCDNILRIEAERHITTQVEFALNLNDYTCEELK